MVTPHSLLSPWVSASAELYEIASPKSPIMEINKEQLSALYLGRNRVVGITYINQVLGRSGTVRQRFFSGDQFAREPNQRFLGLTEIVRAAACAGICGE